MDLKPWVDDKFKVQFYVTYELPRKVTDGGFVARACGISVGAAELIGEANMNHPDYRKDTVSNIEEADSILEDILEKLQGSSTNDELLAKLPDGGEDVTIANYFPGIEVTIETYDGRQIDFTITSNEHEVSPGNRERFIAIMTPEESKIYSRERAD